MTKYKITNNAVKLVMALIATTALTTACSNDEEPQVETVGREITFSVSTGSIITPTRADLVTQVSNEFGLMAYRHSHDSWVGSDELPNFMYRVKATKAANADTWSTATQYYWPHTSEHLRFFAYAPFSEVDEKMSAVTRTGAPQIVEYTVAADALNQKDLMFAVSDDMLCSNGGTVPLQFQHIMSAIKFAVSPGETGTIQSITLSDIPSTGTYTALGSWGTPHTPATYTGQLGTTFILMPQTLPTAAKLTVTYKKDANSPVKNLEFSLSGHTWQQGYIYTYTISIVNSELHPTISAWEAASGDDLKVDYSRMTFDVEGLGFDEHKETRALKTAFDASDVFNIIAFADNTIPPLVADHAAVAQDANTQLWQTVNHYYWPKAQTEMTFYAYYPQALSSHFATLAPPTVPSFTYTVDPTSAQADLLGAKTVYAVNSPNTGNDRHVALQFKHLLCAVCFTVGENSKYGTFQEVKLKGVKKTGTYTFADNAEYWTNLADVVDYAREPNVVADRTSPTTDTSVSGTAIIPSTAPILVVPQELANDAKIYVKFKDEYNVVHELEAVPAYKTLKVNTLVEYKLSISSKFDLTVQTNIANYNSVTTTGNAVME